MKLQIGYKLLLETLKTMEKIISIVLTKMLSKRKGNIMKNR